MQENTLMFTISVNGYDKYYRSNLDSHKKYAEKQGYAYCAVNKPYRLNKTQAAWLKIFLINIALKCHYKWVFFIDADCHININTPPINSVESDNKLIFMAKGFSKRFNSGVIIVKNDQESRMFFNTVQINCERAVDTQDWGENGHVIYYSKFSKYISVLNRKWNNNIDPKLDDYVRHYSKGSIMEELYSISFKDRLVNKAENGWYSSKQFIKRIVLGEKPKDSFSREMDKTVHHCLRYYRQFHIC